MRIIPLFLLLSILLFASCDSSAPGDEKEDYDSIPADSLASRIHLPDGFSIGVFAEVNNARSLALSPSGTVYVGNRGGDKVYALRDTDGDYRADETYVIDSGMNMPNGVAFHDGDLYVAEQTRISVYRQVENDLQNPPAAEVVYDGYPSQSTHGWKYIAFGPDGKLYIPVGAPCNICEPDKEIYASITRMNPDGSGLEIVEKGIRNTVGFDWQPGTNTLWFTDNGRDMLGDSIPPCELNYAPEDGMNFGYPYCHGGYIKDPEFGDKRPCSDFTDPAYKFSAHTAPLGMKFYTGEMFPEEYKGDIIVAQHGSWNRSKKIGYRLMRVSVDNDQVLGATVFADGWLDDASQATSGRPVDVLQLPDGSLLVSDDQAGRIYRISYKS